MYLNKLVKIEKPQRKQLNFNIDALFHKRIKLCALKHNMSMNLFIVMAIDEALKKNEVD